MIVLRTHNKQLGEYQQYLKECNIDYVIKTTTNSATIEYNDINDKYKIMFTDGQYMSIKEMILQKKLKKEVNARTKGKKINYNGERISIKDTRFNKRIIISYDYSLRGVKEIVISELIKRGIKINNFSLDETSYEYIFTTYDFKTQLKK